MTQGSALEPRPQAMLTLSASSLTLPSYSPHCSLVAREVEEAHRSL